MLSLSIHINQCWHEWQVPRRFGMDEATQQSYDEMADAQENDDITVQSSEDEEEGGSDTE